MNDYLAIFVAGVLTGVAVVIVARLTPDILAAARHIASRLRKPRRRAA